MVNTIRKVGDYANLILLQKANEKFQSARGQFKKKKWKEAKNQYEDYIENYNKIDFDAYYELALCCMQLVDKKEEKLKSKKAVEKKQSKKEIDALLDEMIKNLHKAEKYDANTFVPDVILRRKDKRKIIIGILEVKEKLNHDSKFLQMMGRIKRRTN